MGVVRSAQAGWRTGSTPGVAVKLRRDDKPTGASTFLLRLDPGALVPLHDHPGGEELFVIEGDLSVVDNDHIAPDGHHAASSRAGCVVLVTTPKPVRMLEPRA